ncbi:lipopolysaccharide biosynthesis protein [Neorhodopirellula pilleata]|uniref:MurJ-like flippase n=1 Tax=Neorhodopirellula pilleata TaxID=2714738 RepID=A0A5C6AUN5_9BACT|nr:oligosaccharide flippase family protein [Neorhodopirellula pilleata]TWU01874.1 MurJ-like flippase [Neorhodopirellula pilleata]
MNPARTQAASTPSVHPSTRSVERDFRVDSLAVGMVVMLLMTILGRGIGFIRGMAFCRLMDDTDVGRWSMSFDFLTLITPVMLLGIPGVLPKFTEHFRIKGQLQLFVRRIAIGTIGCTLAFVLAMLIAPSWFSYAIFLQTQSDGLIYAVGVAVVGMIFYNFISDLNASLRQVRVVSLMQFIHGVGFTLLSVGWLLSGGEFIGVLWMFTLACVLATIPGNLSLKRNWRSAIRSAPMDRENAAEINQVSGDLRVGVMIKRLAPYAFALWMTNLIGNAFELVDRYMILHMLPIPDGLAPDLLASVKESIGQAAVGQYHSGRIIPMMLLSVAMMIAGVLMPYLSSDWEAKNWDAIKTRVGDVLLAVSTLFTMGSAFAILAGPFVFGVLLQGRYSDGMQLMPMALCFCIWNSLSMIGQCYLLTAEKGRSIAVAMAVGLVANLILNAVLIPTYGLTGAVTATLVAHGVTMTAIWFAMAVYDYPARAELPILSALPLTLLVSPWLAVIVTGTLAWFIWRDENKRTRLYECLPERLRSRLAF